MEKTKLRKGLHIFLLIALLVCGTPPVDASAKNSDAKADCGDGFSAVLTADGELVVWGKNDSGQCDTPIKSGVADMSCGTGHMLAIDEDGKAYAWGDNSFGQCDIPQNKKYKLAAAGAEHSLLVTTDNRIEVYGNVSYEFESEGEIIKAACGGNFSAVLYKSGRVALKGTNEYLSDAVLENAADIAAGRNHLLVLYKNGDVTGIGDNEYSQISIPETENVSAVYAGEYHSILVKKDGRFAVFGGNWANQLPADENIRAAYVGGGYDHTLIITKNGALAAYGDNYYGQCTLPGSIGTVAEITAGLDNAALVGEDGRAYMIGSDASGKSTLPPSDKKIKKIACGGQHTVVLYEDGSISAVGSNIYGQLDIPQQLTNVSDIAAGFDFCLAVQSGQVYAWGYNVYNQCTVPEIGEKVTAVSAGFQHSVALTESGRVVAWGQGGDAYANQTDLPENMGNIAKIKAGAYYTLALDDGGNTYAWGYDGNNQAEVPKTAADIYAGGFAGCVSDENGNLSFFGDAGVYAEAPNKAKLAAAGYTAMIFSDEKSDIITVGSEKIKLPSELFSQGNNILHEYYTDEIPRLTENAPLKLEAENYDVLGSGISYYDTTEGNSYNLYRNDDVEIAATGISDSPYCVSMAKSEWLNHTFYAEKEGDYNVYVSSAATGNVALNIYVNGECAAAGTYVFKTGAYNKFNMGYACPVKLKAGKNQIKTETAEGNFALDYILIEKLDDKPYASINLPGTIKPYQYDVGGCGVGYESPVRLKNGLGSNKIRPYDYISMVNLTGSVNAENIVSSFQPADMLKYSCNVNIPGRYNVYLTYQGNGNANQKGKINLYVNGGKSLDGIILGNASSLTKIYLGSVDISTPKTEIRLENPSVGSYGYLLGNAEFELAEAKDVRELKVYEQGNMYVSEALYANTTGETQKFCIVTAVYGGAKLVGVSLKEFEAAAYTYDTYMSDMEKQNGDVRAFLWNGLPGTGKPILTEIKNEEE